MSKIKINYEEDSEDIDFPPVIYSKDIKDEPSRRKKKSCLNKYLRIFKSKRSLLFVIIGMVIIIIVILIILIVKLKKKKDKENNENVGSQTNQTKSTTEDTEYGGYIIAWYENLDINNKKIINVNKGINELSEGNFSTDEPNFGSTIRNLQSDEISSIIITEIYPDSTYNSWLKENRTYNISFKQIIKSMKEMFRDIPELIKIDLSCLKTEEITNLDSTFLNCNNLKNITFGNFNSLNLKYMEGTFENCTSLEKLNLSSFTMPNIVSMAKAFKNCINLIEIDLSNFELNNAININDTFHLADEPFMIINLFNINNEIIPTISSDYKNINIYIKCKNFNYSDNIVSYDYICPIKVTTTDLSTTSIPTSFPSYNPSDN